MAEDFKNWGGVGSAPSNLNNLLSAGIAANNNYGVGSIISQAGYDFAKAWSEGLDRQKWMGVTLPTLSGFLGQFGLTTLTNKLTQWLGTLSAPPSEEQVLLWAHSQPEFKSRFPAIDAMIAKGQTPITVQQYVDYEKTFDQLMHQYGLNNYWQSGGRYTQKKVNGDPIPGSNEYDGGATQKLITSLITGGVSPSELQNRLEQGYKRVADASPEVREAFKQYFGVEGDQAMAAYFLDPNIQPRLLQRAADISLYSGGFHNTVGEGYLSRSVAERMADAGITQDQAMEGMAKLSQLKDLFQETWGEGSLAEGKAQEHDVDLGRSDRDYSKPGGPNNGPYIPVPAGNKAKTGAPPPGHVELGDGRYYDTATGHLYQRRFGGNDLQAGEEGIDYVFNLSAAAQERVRRRLEQRKADFAGGGGAMLGKGTSGFGAAR